MSTLDATFELSERLGIDFLTLTSTMPMCVFWQIAYSIFFVFVCNLTFNYYSATRWYWSWNFPENWRMFFTEAFGHWNAGGPALTITYYCRGHGCDKVQGSKCRYVLDLCILCLECRISQSRKWAKQEHIFIAGTLACWSTSKTQHDNRSRKPFKQLIVL